MPDRRTQLRLSTSHQPILNLLCLNQLSNERRKISLRPHVGSIHTGTAQLFLYGRHRDSYGKAIALLETRISSTSPVK